MRRLFTPVHGALCALLCLAFAGCSSLPGRGTPDGSSGTSAEPSPVMAFPAAMAFDAGRSTVKPALARQLNALANRLNTSPGTRVNILGHGDDKRSDAANRLLAQDRALSVRDYLIARGVSIIRLRAEGRAATRQLEIHLSDVAPPKAAR
jgi:outer membrane protein OmpA-like peptidoglycan-associated protein